MNQERVEEEKGQSSDDVIVATRVEMLNRIGTTIRRVAALAVAIEYEMLELGRLPVRNSFEGALRSRATQVHDAAREFQRFFYNKSKSKEQFDAFLQEFNSDKMMMISAVLQILLSSDEDSVEQVFNVLSTKWDEEQQRNVEEVGGES